MRVLATSSLLLALAVGGCKRAGDAASRVASVFGEVGDTTVHFGRLDTSLLTNGSGWVRKEPGVMPDIPTQQLQAPESPDSAFTPADTAASPPPSAPDSAPLPAVPESTAAPRRGRRDTLADTLRRRPLVPPVRQRRDSMPPTTRGSARPDTTVPDSTD